MKRKSLLPAIIFILIAVMLVGSVAYAADKRVSTKDGTVSVILPSGWIESPPQLGLSLILRPPKADGGIWANMGLMVTNIPGLSGKDIPLDELFTAVKEDLDKTLKYQNLKKSTMMVLGKKILVIKYDQIREGKPLPTKQYLVFKGDYRYLFTCVAAKETFGKYEATFDKIVKSIKVK